MTANPCPKTTSGRGPAPTGNRTIVTSVRGAPLIGKLRLRSTSTSTRVAIRNGGRGSRR